MRQEIGNFLTLIKILQNIDPEFPLQSARCLAVIYLYEGLSVTELSQRTNLSLSTVSRIVGALSNYRQSGQAYELINLTPSTTSRRTKVITLTNSGRDAIKNIVDALTISRKNHDNVAIGI